MKAKLRPSPPSSSVPILTFAPTAPNETSSCVGGRAGVEHEVARGERHERRDVDLERVDLELERVDLAGGEGQLEAQRLVVERAVRVAVVGRQAVGDRRVERLAREELGAAGGEEDRAAERLRALGEVDAEVLDADPQVVELEDAVEADRARRDERVRVRGRGRVRVHGLAAVLELRLAEREAGVADDQAGLAVRTGGSSRSRRSFGNVIVASCSARICWPAGAFGSYVTSRPEPVIVDHVGHDRLELDDAEAELAGQLDADVAARAGRRRRRRGRTCRARRSGPRSRRVLDWLGAAARCRRRRPASRARRRWRSSARACRPG